MYSVIVVFALVSAAAAGYSWQHRRGLDCKELGEECRGVPGSSCCGNDICYFEDGIGFLSVVKKEGICVTCIQRNLVCQRDDQCCGGTSCLKDGIGDINGVCDSKRGNGEECYKDDQCAAPLTCIKDGAFDVNGKCSNLRRRGESCHKDNQCQSGDCEKGFFDIYGECA